MELVQKGPEWQASAVVADFDYQEMDDATNLYAPELLPSGLRVVRAARGRWTPLCILRLRGPLHAALVGQLDWSDPGVQMEIRELFAASAPGLMRRWLKEKEKQLLEDL